MPTWQHGGCGVVQAFRRQECADESITLKLRGLDPRAVYELTDLDAPGVKRASGKELMETGLTLASAQKPHAMIVTYRRTEAPARR